MTSINYNEFQAGQGVSAPALNENFTLTNTAIETLETNVNTAISTLSTATSGKANKNGNSTENFSVADATETTHAVNLGQLNSTLVPSGAVIIYAGASAPTGYLLCNGNAVSRTDYANLFTAIGTTFGSGDGSTTFNLPNLIDKYIKTSDTSEILTGDATKVTTSSGNKHSHSYAAGASPTYTGEQAAHSHTLSLTNITLLPCIKV